MERVADYLSMYPSVCLSLYPHPAIYPPLCIGCDQRLTIEHILLTCSDFIEIRESHFTAKSLRMLFKDISPEKIFNFLKEINIFGKI